MKSLGGFEIWACVNCGLRFAPGAFSVRVDYNAIYSTQEYYESQVREMESQDVRNDFRHHGTYRYFFEKVSKKGNVELLDVGCGVGRFLHAAAASGFSVSGIDVSAQAIERGKVNADFPMRCLTVEQAIEEPKRYDVVTAFEVLEHLSDPVEFLVKILKLLKPGGTVFCTVPNWDSPMHQHTERKDWIPPVHLCFHTKRSLAMLGHIAGLGNVHCGYILSDPVPGDLWGKLRWLVRRVKNIPLVKTGIWMSALDTNL